MLRISKRLVVAVVLSGLLALFIARSLRPREKTGSAEYVLVPTHSVAAPAAVPTVDFNARDEQGRTSLFRATEARDQQKVTELLEHGANLEIPDTHGVTPLMLAASTGDLELIRTFQQHGAKLDIVDSERNSAVQRAIAARQSAAIDLLLEAVPQLEPPAPDQPDLLASACATNDPKVIAAILRHAPANLEWTNDTRTALQAALAANDQDLTHLLLSKHPSSPTLEGRNIPLLAQAMVDDQSETFHALLAAGADPNTTLPFPVDKQFLKALPADLRDYAKVDEGVTVLMIAAAQGKPELVRTLLDAGAARNRMTKRHKMLALYFAVRTDKYNAVQMLLGTGPTPEELRIEISLAKQRASVIKGGTSIFQTQCSTGREGFATRVGRYVITDKDRSHRSSIYKVEMPYFMRLNCLDFGMHEGVVPNHPASHGCIRLPSAAARKLFSEIPVGTVVMID